MRDYRGKRDFGRTREPEGRAATPGAEPLSHDRKGRAAHTQGRGTPDPRRARSVRSGRTLAQVAADVRED
ncbi:hypothetical protein [Streptomyces sp. NPDC127197]|uniref:hypothetical protein n=1 Tax=Streptomyces sp. NPDC127197 TaxID=3345388 RepID=UPI003641412F